MLVQSTPGLAPIIISTVRDGIVNPKNLTFQLVLYSYIYNDVVGNITISISNIDV